MINRVCFVFVCGCSFFIQCWWMLSSLYSSFKSLDVICKWFCLAVTVPKMQGVDIGPKFNLSKRSPFSEHSLYHGSPNQAKWATSLPWFQWNRPISVKKRSFNRPVSLFKSVFFSPIIILFLQYSHKYSMFPKCDPYRVWCSIFYSKLVNCILFKICK